MVSITLNGNTKTLGKTTSKIVEKTDQAVNSMVAGTKRFIANMRKTKKEKFIDMLDEEEVKEKVEQLVRNTLIKG